MADYNNIIQGGAAVLVGSDLGYITDGVTFAVIEEMYYKRPEGVSMDVHARRVSQNYEIRTTLLEPTMANMQIALDWQGTSATASGGLEQLEFGNDGNFKPSASVVKIYGYVPGSGGFTRYVQLDRAVAITNVESSFQDAEETKLPLAMHALYDATNSRAGLLSDATS